MGNLSESDTFLLAHLTSTIGTLDTHHFECYPGLCDGPNIIVVPMCNSHGRMNMSRLISRPLSEDAFRLSTKVQNNDSKHYAVPLYSPPWWRIAVVQVLNLS